MEYKIITGKSTDVQKTLNQWKHDYNIDVLKMVVNEGWLNLLVTRSRKTVMVLLFLLSSVSSFAQLNPAAQKLKDMGSSIYEDIKIFAVNKWDDDHRMVVYEINTQTEALIKIFSLKDQPDYNEELLGKALVKWGEVIRGKTYEDYRMVLYEYKKNLKAYKSY